MNLTDIIVSFNAFEISENPFIQFLFC